MKQQKYKKENKIKRKEKEERVYQVNVE